MGLTKFDRSDVAEDQADTAEDQEQIIVVTVVHHYVHDMYISRASRKRINRITINKILRL